MDEKQVSDELDAWKTLDGIDVTEGISPLPFELLAAVMAWRRKNESEKKVVHEDG